MNVAKGTNSETVIGGRAYGGHALDEMQSEGFTPSIVEQVLEQGVAVRGPSGRIAYYDAQNNVSVLTESDGRIVTVTSGRVSKVR